MHLVQILLPLFDNDGKALPAQEFAQVRRELTDRFGGLTAFTRSPAEGLWKPEPGQTRRDDVVVFEVMVRELDRPWWKDYRAALEHAFRQTVIVVRAQAIELL